MRMKIYIAVIILGAIGFLIKKLAGGIWSRANARQIHKHIEREKQIEQQLKESAEHITFSAPSNRIKCPECGASVPIKGTLKNANCIYCGSLIPELQEAFNRQKQQVFQQSMENERQLFELEKARLDLKKQRAAGSGNRFKMIFLIIMLIVVFAYFGMLFYITR